MLRKVSKTTIIKPQCHIDFYKDFYKEEKATKIFEYFEKKIKWPERSFKKNSKTFHTGLRANQNYGDEGITYELNFGGYNGRPKHTTVRKVLPWNELPGLTVLRDRVTKITGQKFNYCVILRYPSGNVEIHPHRDRETKSTIAGVSFGETRTLRMLPPYYSKEENIDIQLNNGSLYVLNHPTNDFWKHSIPKEPDMKGIRISVTFRYQE